MKPTRSSIALAAGAALVLVTGVPASRAATLLPHRAIYELSLKSVGTSANIVDVKGAIFYEFTETCTGWKVRHNTRMQILNQESVERDRETKFSSWEAKDGLSFRFNSTTRVNGRISDRYRGRAKLGGRGKAGRAVFTRPRGVVVQLPVGTVFPTTHIAQVLDRAAAGDKFVWRVVFDGTDGKNLYAVNVAIGKEGPGIFDADKLLSARRWPMNLAYFAAAGRPKSQPEYELSLHLHVNSVTSDLVIDHGDFVLDAKLKRIEALPPAKC